MKVKNVTASALLVQGMPTLIQPLSVTDVTEEESTKNVDLVHFLSNGSLKRLSKKEEAELQKEKEEEERRKAEEIEKKEVKEEVGASTLEEAYPQDKETVVSTAEDSSTFVEKAKSGTGPTASELDATELMNKAKEVSAKMAQAVKEGKMEIAPEGEVEAGKVIIPDWIKKIQDKEEKAKKELVQKEGEKDRLQEILNKTSDEVLRSLVKQRISEISFGK